MLIIIVGESGTGKSTFVEAMDCPENWYVSSQAMIEELGKQGIKVTHDTIHAFAKKMYEENPYWQISHILAKLKGKDFLVLDGPRQILEIKRLIELPYSTFIIRIKADSIIRYNRLENRDKISFEDFRRIEKDEIKETGLKEVFEELVDFVIENNGSLERLQRIAKEIRVLLNKWR